MTLPSWIEPKISLGNILTILALLGGMLTAAQGYGGLVESVEQQGAEISAIKQDAVNLRTQVADDRSYARETLAEVKVDVGYIRRYVEEERRAVRQ